MRKIVAKITALLLSGALCFAAFSGCGGIPIGSRTDGDSQSDSHSQSQSVSPQESASPEPPPAVSVTLDKSSVEIEAEKSVQLFASVKNAGSEYTVEWSSDREEVATVSSAGIVTGVAPGTAVVTAAVGTASGSCVVTVKEQPGAVDFVSNGVAYNKISIPVGSSYRLPMESSGRVSWRVDKEGVSVADGIVTAAAAGEYTATATAGGEEKRLDIRVYAETDAALYLKQYDAGTDLRKAEGIAYWGDAADVYSVASTRDGTRFGMDVQEKQALYRFDFVFPEDYAQRHTAASGLGENIIGIYNLNDDGKGMLGEFIKDSSLGGTVQGYEGNNLRIYDRKGKMIETPGLSTFKGGEIYTLEYNCTNAFMSPGRYMPFTMTYDGLTYVSNAAALYYVNFDPTIIFAGNAVSTAPGTSLTVPFATENIADDSEVSFDADKEGFTAVNNGDGTFTVSVAENVTEKRATITAKWGETCEATIFVNVRPVTISLDRSAAELFVGKTVTAVATVENAGDGASVSWASSDDAVATVHDGLITGVAAGAAIVTASCKGVSAEIAVTVTRQSSVKFESRGIAYNRADIPVGSTYALPIVSEGTPAWSVGDDAAGLAVSNGVLRASAAGRYTVVALADRGNASLEVNVYASDKANEYCRLTHAGGGVSMTAYTGEEMNVWNTEAYIYKIDIPAQPGASEDRAIGRTVAADMALYRFDFAFAEDYTAHANPYGGDNMMAHLNWDAVACVKTSSSSMGGGYENDAAKNLLAFYDKNGYMEKPVETSFKARESYTCEISTAGIAGLSDPTIKMNICYDGAVYVTNVVALYQRAESA